MKAMECCGDKKCEEDAHAGEFEEISVVRGFVTFVNVLSLGTGNEFSRLAAKGIWPMRLCRRPDGV